METPYNSKLTAHLLCSALILPYSNGSRAEIHASLSVVSNYVSRGYSKSSDKFSYQANIDYEHDSGLYLGASAATVDFGDEGFDDRAQFEITPYLGWSANLDEDWRLDSQWTRYLYDGPVFGIQSDYNEFYLFLHYQDIITLAASFSEDYYNRGHPAGIYELTGRYPITDLLEFSSGIGYAQTHQSLEYDYLYWNAGVTCNYKMISLDLRYADAATPVTSHGHSDAGQTMLYPQALSPTLLFSVAMGF